MKFLNALAEGNRYLESFRELYEGSFPPLEKNLLILCGNGQKLD